MKKIIKKVQVYIAHRQARKKFQKWFDYLKNF